MKICQTYTSGLTFFLSFSVYFYIFKAIAYTCKLQHVTPFSFYVPEISSKMGVCSCVPPLHRPCRENAIFSHIYAALVMSAAYWRKESLYFINDWKGASKNNAHRDKWGERENHTCWCTQFI